MRIDIKYNADVNELMEDNMSFYGFTLQELKLARYLIENDISPREIIRIQDNLEWAYKEISKEYDKAYRHSLQRLEKDYKIIRRK